LSTLFGKLNTFLAGRLCPRGELQAGFAKPPFDLSDKLISHLYRQPPIRCHPDRWGGLFSNPWFPKTIFQRDASLRYVQHDIEPNLKSFNGRIAPGKPKYVFKIRNSLAWVYLKVIRFISKCFM
jgi:hypothetical protein